MEGALKKHVWFGHKCDGSDIEAMKKTDSKGTHSERRITALKLQVCVCVCVGVSFEWRGGGHSDDPLNTPEHAAATTHRRWDPSPSA